MFTTHVNFIFCENQLVDSIDNKTIVTTRQQLQYEDSCNKKVIAPRKQLQHDGSYCMKIVSGK